MDTAVLPIQIRWADVDANHHLRHSVYYDYGALARMQILTDLGLSMEKLKTLEIGPILLREEAVFKREIKFEDKLEISTSLLHCTKDYSRWTIRHQLIKNTDTLAAIITIDGAWMDLNKRKFALPNEFVIAVFDQLPKAPEFVFVV